jgi:hypothetical protein
MRQQDHKSSCGKNLCLTKLSRMFFISATPTVAAARDDINGGSNSAFGAIWHCCYLTLSYFI